MLLSTPTSIPVYTIAGTSTARPLPEWLARKRKRSLKTDPDYASRIELLQDFSFAEASSCVRVSEDGDYLMSTGTYKPQIHTHYLPHLSLSYARHTNTVNTKFVLLGSDYSKSLHLQEDRVLEFHDPGGVFYSTRIPRYGRDIVYNRRAAEVLVPSVGVNAGGWGEVYRLNLEVGRFMKGFEVDVGGDDFGSAGGGALQGGIKAGAVNCAAVAESSHGLLAFGTSIGTVEFWDSRSRNRVSALSAPRSILSSDDETPEITALTFSPSGLNLASGTSTGLIHTYDLRSPLPLLRKEQGYGFPIKTLTYLPSHDLLLSADKKSIKLWESATGNPWTSVEPAVDLNHVEHIPSTGMIVTANEGSQQHAFLIPALGPAPKWCSFLDNLVEEMAEDSSDPAAFNTTTSGSGGGEVYDNYKFLSLPALRSLSLDHLIGQTNLLRPYMHGYFVAQKLWEQARLLVNPDLAADARKKSVQEKIDKERESRVRGPKKAGVKVNRRLAEKLAAREEVNARRKAARVLKNGGDAPKLDEDVEDEEAVGDDGEEAQARLPSSQRLLQDPRFGRLFEDEEFAIDESSREFAAHNPSTAINPASSTAASTRTPRTLTAVEEEEVAAGLATRSSDEEGTEDSADEDAEAEAAALSARQKSRAGGFDKENQASKGRIGAASYKRQGKVDKFKGAGERSTAAKNNVRMKVSSSTGGRPRQQGKSMSLGEMAGSTNSTPLGRRGEGGAKGGVVGERSVTFNVEKKKQERRGGGGSGREERGGGEEGGNGRAVPRGKERRGEGEGGRRTASKNAFRGM